MKTFDYITDVEKILDEPLRVKAWRERLSAMTLRVQLTDELRSATKRLADAFLEYNNISFELESLKIEIAFAIIQISDIENRIGKADAIAAAIQHNTTED